MLKANTWVDTASKLQIFLSKKKVEDKIIMWHDMQTRRINYLPI